MTHIAGKAITPAGVGVENPAFDVTPAKYVTAIVTECGIARAPYEQSLAALVREEGKKRPLVRRIPIPGLTKVIAPSGFSQIFLPKPTTNKSEKVHQTCVLRKG